MLTQVLLDDDGILDGPPSSSKTFPSTCEWSSRNRAERSSINTMSSIAPSNIYSNDIVEISAVIDYENPKSVNLVIAKVESDVLAEDPFHQ